MTTSRRSTPLPDNWNELRDAALQRDYYECQWAGTDGVCGALGNHCDHITPAYLGGGDDLNNLRALCEYHHNLKTAREASAAAKANRINPNRQPEAHPGLI